MTITTPLDQAKLLASSYRDSDPSVERALWFPDENEIRLLLVSSEIAASASETEVHPFYFRASEIDGLHLPSAIAYVSPLEVGRLKLPSGWVDWSAAVSL